MCISVYHRRMVFLCRLTQAKIFAIRQDDCIRGSSLCAAKKAEEATLGLVVCFLLGRSDDDLCSASKARGSGQGDRATSRPENTVIDNEAGKGCSRTLGDGGGAGLATALGAGGGTGLTKALGGGGGGAR